MLPYSEKLNDKLYEVADLAREQMSVRTRVKVRKGVDIQRTLLLRNLIGDTILEAIDARSMFDANRIHMRDYYWRL